MRIAIARLPGGAGLPLPRYATAGSAGLDLAAAVESEVVIGPGERVAIPTGFCLAVPPGYEAQIRPRSGLALHHGVLLPNAPGTIDSDYRGEVRVLVLNAGDVPFVVRRGDRIAQLVVAPVSRVEWEEREGLEGTARGKGGFGHTGRSAVS